MGLQPLEFADCLTDSPYFRTKLAEHEKELESTSKFIKTLVHHGRDVYSAAKQFSKAQRAFAKDLMEFKFECIGNNMTDGEICISESLRAFARFIEKIEDQRDILINNSEDHFVKPLENFRKENIGAAKEEKKNFDKQTTKFCQSQERYLNMKPAKINDSILQEADTQVEFEKKAFYTASMKYVLKLQEVQERKKFEFVEILLSYMLSWVTFYHQGYVDLEDFMSYDYDLRQLLQKTRENFEYTRDEAQTLMGKMLNENKGLKPQDQSGTMKGFTRQGYLYLMEKKTLGTTSWTKYYCQYKKETKQFVMILYNQIGDKRNNPEKYTLETCVRRASDTIEKRFCFDVTVKEKTTPMTFQALSDDDRRMWLDAMDGKEPTYQMHHIKTEDTMLDDIGFNFMRRSIATIESRGLSEQGLYRVVGVNSKVNNLLKVALDAKKADKVNYEDPSVWETKTITSAVKSYLRTLPEPLMTFKLHENFIKAAKQESKTLRILDVHKYVHQLPQSNFEMLDMLISHLKRISEESETNKMTVANLGVCFGPSLMRPEEESMAAIMDIKFCNIVVEISSITIENFIKAAKQESKTLRILDVHKYVHQLPQSNFEMLDMLISHLKRISEESETNKMTVANLGVCFGPSLMRPEEESMAAIMDIKFCNIVVEILINNYDQIFKTPPDGTDPSESRLLPSSNNPPVLRPHVNTGGGAPKNSEPIPRPVSSMAAIGRNANHSGNAASRIYANQAPIHPHAGARVKQRPVQIFNANTGGFEIHSSTSSSTESLNSAKSALSPRQLGGGPWGGTSPLVDKGPPRRGSGAPKDSQPTYSNVSALASRFNQNSSSSDVPTLSTSMHGSLTGSISSLSSSKPPGRTVITRYPCVADNYTELSFEANQLITDVRPTPEEGWLQGTLNGKTGIIPMNHVEFID
ncbi:hypothetical protein EGW08_007126 [Elysia chlorotica]|uniref:Rho GTPase-activating protein 26 n=1 Tax=Elysia chlorotica TaxID=188477 RepID=A0A3S1HSA0_ELYCH|nr:hypothetical protein EGW08_007126 [Elysia chlorotica]